MYHSPGLGVACYGARDATYQKLENITPLPCDPEQGSVQVISNSVLKRLKRARKVITRRIFGVQVQYKDVLEPRELTALQRFPTLAKGSGPAYTLPTSTVGSRTLEYGCGMI